MGFIKQGEAVNLESTALQSAQVILSDSELNERFMKLATEAKKVAPKADDFLYFTAVMMHAAEASLLDETGSLRKDAAGNPVTVRWDKDGESWKWVCSDPEIQPYRNANRDIFPEEELVKAHKEWVGKPLCLDHRSDSVDHIRGIIIDTYYDMPKKRVVALCALDKVNHPDLARKVATLTSTAVSMGTAVGRAICTTCGTVARAEGDFCQHMRMRTCYGEINVDLKPIELSIVVNGADPKAHIRHVLAAANQIARYVNEKETLVTKFSTHDMVDPDVISDLKADLKNVMEKLEKLEDQAQKVEETEEAEEQESEADEDDVKDASLAEDKIKVASILSDLHSKVDQLQSTMAKLQKNSEETDMSNKKEAYFQGGGGVNEPTPGQPKYEKEDYQSLRDGEDKQMVGQMETGPVDGMHPGYDSFGEGEEERKRRLQRLAEEKAEERALRRQAVIDELKSKTAYFQGGGDVNEPTPGEPKYEKEDYQTNRDKNDKQMTGQAPFPGVGAVDGLHPSPASADESDELKRKQMLSRAKLKGSFYPAAKSDGTPDKGNSRWNVFAKSGDKKQLILTATVDEITGGKAELLYNSVASRDFGKHLLKLVQSHDVSKVAEMIKSAQMLEPMAPEAPAGEAEMPEDAGGTGDPKDELPELLDAAENTLADIRKAVEALMDEPGSELAEFEELAEGGLEAAAELRQLGKYQVKMAKALLVGMQKAAGALQENVEELQMSKQIKESKVALPEEHLKMASELTTAAMDDTRSTLDKCRELMQAFVSYAGGSKSVEKRAEELRANLVKAAQFAETGLKGDPLDPDLGLDDEPKAPAAPKQPGSPMQPREKTLEDYLRMFGFVGNLDALSPEQEDKKLAQVFSKAFDLFQRVSEENRGMALKLLDRLPRSLQILLLQGERFGKDSVTKMLASQSGPGYAKTYQADDGMDAHMGDDHHMGDDMNGGMDGLDALMTMMADDEGDMNDLEMTLQDGTKITASEQDDMTTKSGRAALRAKLAQKAMQYSDMLEKAHPGGGESPDLEVGEGELSNVERLDEQQKKDLDVATAPVAVRKMAEEIHNLVAEGKVDPAVDFPELIANGVDPAAVAYYKQYFGEAKDGGSEFATDLVKEHAQKKRAAEMEAYQVKVARAWELADDMVARSMLANDRQAKKAQVEEILKFNDEAFKTFAEFVSRQPVKKASAMPQVGQLMSSAEIHLPAPQAAPTNLQAELAAAFSQPRKNRTF